jgi:hypothetical protein
MVRLLNLPADCTVLTDEFMHVRSPYSHGQRLVAIQLHNGILIEAHWDDYGHRCTIVASEGQGENKMVVGNRSVTNPIWVPGVVSNMAASLANTQPQAAVCSAD